jgi:hypothetical protein
MAKDVCDCGTKGPPNYLHRPWCPLFGHDLLPEDTPCPSCGKVNPLKKSPWIDKPICEHCMDVWYDTGTTDPEKVRELSLKRQGDLE